MSWGAAILGALKAVPKVVDAIDRLGDRLEEIEETRIDNKYRELKEHVNVLTKKIESASTNAERVRLARELNSVVSR